MQKAFTMIELIFVIVIIGILAAVAIPKLTATRDDAKASIELSNLAIYVKDVANYYSATGVADVNHTNVKLHCFVSTITETDENISMNIVSGGTDDGEEYCIKAQKDALTKKLMGSQIATFGGTLVKYD